MFGRCWRCPLSWPCIPSPDPLRAANHWFLALQVHLGFKVEWVTRAAQLLAATLLLWLVLLVIKAATLALGLDLHIPVPTVDFLGLWLALSHADYGLPALPGLLHGGLSAVADSAVDTFMPRSSEVAAHSPRPRHLYWAPSSPLATPLCPLVWPSPSTGG